MLTGARTRQPKRRPPVRRPGLVAAVSRRPSRVVMAATLLLAVAVYARTLANGFIDFDDPEDILDNYSIRELSWANLVHWFSTPLEFMYTPLASVSYAIDYQVGQLSPVPYHVTNLVLHLANVVLVFLVVRALTGRLLLAHIASVAMAVHPVNADAVAWIATRSNLLATLFSLGAVLAYLRYLRRPGWRGLGLAVALFTLATLAKPTAVVLPAVLVLVDLYQGRRYRHAWRPFLDKLPFLVLAALMGLVALHFRIDTINPPGYTMVDRAAIVCAALVAYLVRAVVPVHLAMAYAYPARSGGHLAWYLYLAPVALLATAGALLLIRPARRLVSFGLAFFLVNILPSQLVWLIDNHTANRYAYLPYVGLFLIAGYGIEQLLRHARTWRWLPEADALAIGLLAGVVVTFSVLAGLRGAQWRDTRTIMTASIAVEPRVAFVYSSRGIAELNDREYQAARADFEQTLRLDPDYVLAYFYLGKIKHIDGDDTGAVQEFDEALSRDPGFAVAYAERARSRAALRDTSGALADLATAIGLDSYYVDAYYQRGVLETAAGDYPAARADLDRVVSLDPGYGDGWYQRGLAEDRMGGHAAACADWRKAQSLGQPDAGNALGNGC